MCDLEAGTPDEGIMTKEEGLKAEEVFDSITSFMKSHPGLQGKNENLSYLKFFFHGRLRQIPMQALKALSYGASLASGLLLANAVINPLIDSQSFLIKNVCRIVNLGSAQMGQSCFMIIGVGGFITTLVAGTFLTFLPTILLKGYFWSRRPLITPRFNLKIYKDGLIQVDIASV